MSRPPIKIGLPKNAIYPDDLTGNFPANKWTVDRFDVDDQPARLDIWSRLAVVDTRRDFVLGDGSRDEDLTTLVHILAAFPSLPITDAAADSNLVPVAWALDICDPALIDSPNYGEVLNWQYVVAFQDPLAFNTQVPANVRNSIWVDPEGELPDRQKYWWEMSQSNSDIGYWKPNAQNPDNPSACAWPCWFSDGTPLSGRNCGLIDAEIGIVIQSVGNWNEQQAEDGDWKVITQADLDRWGWTLP